MVSDELDRKIEEFVDQVTSGRQPIFRNGDLVRHRASGQKGIVLMANHVCNAHDGPERVCCRSANPKCHWMFSGTYQVSVALGKTVRGVREDLLECVTAPPTYKMVCLVCGLELSWSAGCEIKNCPDCGLEFVHKREC